MLEGFLDSLVILVQGRSQGFPGRGVVLTCHGGTEATPEYRSIRSWDEEPHRNHQVSVLLWLRKRALTRAEPNLESERASLRVARWTEERPTSLRAQVKVGYLSTSSARRTRGRGQG